MRETNPTAKRVTALVLAAASAAACRAPRDVSPAVAGGDGYGAVVMAHGGGAPWDRAVLEVVEPLRRDHDVAVDVLAGCDHAADGRGLPPHPRVGEWIARQASALERGPFRAPVEEAALSQAAAAPGGRR